MSRTSGKKKKELIEKKLKLEQAKLSKKLALVLSEYRKYWPKDKFEEKLGKTTHLFITEKKLKMAMEKPAAPVVAKKGVKKATKGQKTVA
jgi:hypothetical protein